MISCLKQPLSPSFRKECASLTDKPSSHGRNQGFPRARRAYSRWDTVLTINRPMEVKMSSTDVNEAISSATPEPGVIDMKLEVVTLPVTDVDRAKRFYQSLGWRLDADIVRGDAFRAVQLTPPHSSCSVAFGKGLTSAEPGSARRLLLVVSDVAPAREDLRRRGVEVSEVFHLDGGRVPGPDPARPLLPDLRRLQRPGRKRVAPAGDQNTAPGPRVGGLTQYRQDPDRGCGDDRELHRSLEQGGHWRQRHLLHVPRGRRRPCPSGLAPALQRQPR